MSKPRLKIYLEVDTVAHGQTIKDAIQNRLVGKDIFEEHSFSFGVGNESDPNVVWGLAEFRFNNRIDRDDVLDWIKDQVQNHPQVKTWVMKATVTAHLCSHSDVEVKNCRETEFNEWAR